MKMSSLPKGIRAMLIFLTFAVVGPVVGCLILGVAGSSFLAPMIDPQRTVDGTMFVYIFCVAFAFGAIPAIIAGLVMVLRFFKSGYFRAGDAVFAAFAACPLAGPAYHYFYRGIQPTGEQITNSMLVACMAVGPVAALCGFMSHKSVRALGLIEEPGKRVDVRLET